jgi:poly(3-hydroxybutyrate) depolymerase
MFFLCAFLCLFVATDCAFQVHESPEFGFTGNYVFELGVRITQHVRMKPLCLWAILPLLLLSPLSALEAKLEALLPPVKEGARLLCPRDYLTPETGAKLLRLTIETFPDRSSWQTHAEFLRKKIQEGAGLSPYPKRNRLVPIVGARSEFDGYSVENVAFEALPGYFVTGNLYRPLGKQGPFAVVLSTHGHGSNKSDPANFENVGRFNKNAQTRCAMLARMGALVFSIDAFAYGESCIHATPGEHQSALAMPMQIWDNMRALDFLLSLRDADPARVAVTGESGGGTQSILLTALDSRVTVSVPVVMVSSYFFGGCPCESGRPIHRGSDFFADNAIIAALAAPRPMLLVSDGGDWTQHTPETEFPFMRAIYRLYGAEGSVENAHLAGEGHDYGASKRQAMYRFLIKHLRLVPGADLRSDGNIDEGKARVLPMADLRVFNEKNPAPSTALKGLPAIEEALKAAQAGQ